MLFYLGFRKWFTGVHRKFLSHIGLSVVVADLSAGVYNVVYSFVWFPSRGIFLVQWWTPVIMGVYGLVRVHSHSLAVVNRQSEE
jgi:hypothetical protein